MCGSGQVHVRIHDDESVERVGAHGRTIVIPTCDRGGEGGFIRAGSVGKAGGKYRRSPDTRLGKIVDSLDPIIRTVGSS